jgi:hypothetical protein
VHFDEARSVTAVDLQDGAMPRRVVDSAIVSPLQSVFRKLRQIESSADGIAIVGDLSTKGDSGIYKECAEYLISNLQLIESGRTIEQIHVVPGNHDVDHELVGQDDVLAKFVPLQTIWRELGVPAIAATEPRQSTISNDGSGAVAMFGLNSAIGSGEHCAPSTQIPGDVAAAIQDAKAELGESEDSFGVNSELLDMPSFSEDDIAATCAKITELPPEVMPIVVAHHNLMPQAQPRIAPYTHVINGGLVRARLSACERPVLYLHGHIHERPVEVVRQCYPRQGELICVSAPLIIHGFNLIELFFTDAGLPVGCAVREFTVSSDGGVEEQGQARIPLLSQLANAGTLTKFIVTALTNHSPYRFTELLEEVRKSSKKPIENERELADALLEAEWLGLVTISERKREPRHWRVAGELP